MPIRFITDVLPALLHDGVWISGYRPIVNHLTSKSLCRDLDEDLTSVQRADAVAHSAFLFANAAPLVDLSLYVSAANWSASTRPAYSSLLSFPLTWTLPPLLRAQAIQRAQHLGMAELDTDFDSNSGLHLTASRDALPETFRRHLPATTKKTVRDEMTPEQAAAIRLLSLVEDCLSVVNSLILEEQPTSGKPPRFFPNISAPSSLDCLAYGFLALMVVPSVPRSFLKDWILAKTPRLAFFVDSMAPSKLTPTTSQAEAAVGFSLRIADSLLRSLPGVGIYYAEEMRHRSESGVTGLGRRAWYILTGLVATGATLSYGSYTYKRLAPFGAWKHVWRRQEVSKLSQFGELGSMLSSAMSAH